MARVVKGYDTTCTIGASQSVAKVRKYSHTSAKDKTENGPWFGEPTKDVSTGGKLGTLTLEGDVPIGGDDGIDDILNAYENDLNSTLSLATNSAYNITYSSPAYTAFDIETDANGTQTWKATIEGAYTIVQDS